MNNSVAEKYSAMTAHAQVLVSQMGELKEKCICQIRPQRTSVNSFHRPKIPPLPP